MLSLENVSAGAPNSRSKGDRQWVIFIVRLKNPVDGQFAVELRVASTDKPLNILLSHPQPTLARILALLAFLKFAWDLSVCMFLSGGFHFKTCRYAYEPLSYMSCVRASPLHLSALLQYHCVV